MSATNYLGLNIPDKNSKGRVVTEVFEPNFTKLDQNAEVVDRDKNAIWGGLDGGGLIEDPYVTKVVGRRYIGADGKSYICLVPSDVNNTTNYAPCNVVDSSNEIKKLFYYNHFKTKFYNFEFEIERFGKICILSVSSQTPTQNTAIITGFPEWAKPKTNQCGALTGDSSVLATGEMYVRTDSSLQWFVNKIDVESLYTGQIIYIADN
ncbi:MAG: hypothetical protein ACRCX2_07045 [Paraclostridium sp.]